MGFQNTARWGTHRCTPQTVREQKMSWPSVTQWWSVFHTKRDGKGNLCTMDTQEKYQVHVETHRWRNNNLHSEISERICVHLKGKLCSPRKKKPKPNNSKKEYMSALKTTKNFHNKKFPRAVQWVPSYKMWFLCISTLFICLHFLLLASYAQIFFSFQAHHHETAIFISIARNFCMFVLN